MMITRPSDMHPTAQLTERQWKTYHYLRRLKWSKRDIARELRVSYCHLVRATAQHEQDMHFEALGDVIRAEGCDPRII